MLDIIVLIFLCNKNGDLASRKGLKPGTWRLYTILAWIVAEILGLFIGIVAFGKGNLVGLILFSLASAFGGYLLVRAILEKKPDPIEEDINSIDINDLRP